MAEAMSKEKHSFLRVETAQTELLSFWKSRLGTDLPVLNLPVRRQSSTTEGRTLLVRKRLLSPEDLEKAEQWSRRWDIDLFAMMASVFQVLLCRYSGQEDLLVEALDARTVGEDARTYLIRSDLSANPPFAETVRHLAAWLSDVHDLPLSYELLQQLLTSDHSDNLKVRFAWQLNDLDAHMHDCDLLLALETVSDGVQCVLSYNPALFAEEIADSMHRHFATLLQSAVENPEYSVQSLALLEPAEAHAFQVNGVERSYPMDLCMHQMFERQVDKTSNAVALIWGEERLTYQQVNRRANRLAHHLQELGVGPDKFVGVCLQRTPDLVISLLAVLKAGGAYIPLDPNYPHDRIAFMLEDTQANVLLTQEALLDLAANAAMPVLCIDRVADDIAKESAENPVSAVTSRNLGYVIYTSGSTGRPKGVAIEHYSATVLLHWAMEVYAPEELSGVLFSTSVCFDMSIYEIFLTLSVGGKLIIAKNALQLPELPAAGEVTLVNTVPSAIAELCRMGGIPAGVRTINLGGEPLKQALVEQLYAIGTVERVYNLYGPSEDTTFSTYALMPKDLNRIPLIGVPIANTQAYVLNAYLQPCPIGVPGELFLSGDGLAREYLNRPELTAERFLTNPFSEQKGSRMYRTGDLFVIHPNGTLDCLGRIDHQVKIRGFRIELGEIEARLMKHAAVRESVVVAIDDELGTPYLAAYYSLQEGSAVEVRELRNFLKETLPDYMIPAYLIELHTLPLSPNGKVDRRSLPAPDRSLLLDASQYVAPRSSIERALVELFADVLKLSVERIGIHDHFFELGGHSLLGTQLLSRIRDHLQADLSIGELFACPTVAELGGKIAELAGEDQKYERMAIIRHRDAGWHELSYAQQRVWFHEQFEPGGSLYIIPVVMRLTGELDQEALQFSLHEIMRRHDVLRATYVNRDGKPVQVIAPESGLKLQQADLGDLPLLEREERFQSILAEEASRTFDLTEGPLLRAKLVRLTEREHRLILCMHHILSDDWSLAVFSEELVAHYQAYRCEEQQFLNELPIQYADFAAFQREWLEQVGLKKQLSYWQDKLCDHPPFLELPTDRPRPPKQTHDGAAVEFELEMDVAEGIKRLCRQEGVTPFMVLLAAFKVLLHRYTGQKDLLVGSPIANRNRSEVEKLIGFFVNTIVLRSDLSGDPSFRDYLRQIRQVATEAYMHQDVPFDRLVEALQPERDLSYSPLFQVLFNLQNVPVTRYELPDLMFEPLEEVFNGTSKFDMSLFLQEREASYRGQWVFNTDLFDRETIESMVAHYQTLLAGILQSPDETIGQLPLLEATERNQYLVEWNRTARSFPQDLLIHQLVHQQATQTPDAVAVVYKDQQLTYRELDQRADRVARSMLQRGTETESLIGLCVERSAEMIVGLLGILKAGAAYVPLDPKTPADRLAVIIEEAGLHWILTQRDLASTLPASDSQVVLLEEVASAPATEAESLALPDVEAHHLAYVIFTSGSTGKPKGVLVEHGNLLNYTQSVLEVLDVEPRMSFASVSTLAADLGNTMIFPALCTGGSLHVLALETATDPQALADYMRRQPIDCLKIVPSHLAALLSSQQELVLPRKRLVFGGEPLRWELVRKVRDHAPDCRIINHYGPTETTVGVLTYQVPKDELSMSASVPLGRPLANLQMFVLDHHRQPVPAGVIGELYIGGAGVTRGYLHNPELTADRYVANPFGCTPARLYRTGDRVRYLKDGRIEFWGRADNQVKIRGYRIELEEVEAVISEHPWVLEQAVLVYEPEPEHKQLVAYLVAADPDAFDARAFRAALQQKLPGYMIPSHFVVLDEIPLTSNGKVNRRALPAPTVEAVDGESGYAEPETETERTLASLFAQLLYIERVGRHDHFFERGGHSLLATQLISRIRQAFQIDISLRTIFEAPTVAQFAARVEALRLTSSPADRMEEPKFVRVSRDQDLQLSFAQQRLWFLEELTPGTSLYNVPLMVRLRGRLHVEALAASLQEIVRRHEVLRTTFARRGQQTVQVIHPPAAVPVPVPLVDLMHLHDSEREERANELILEDVQKSFDLERGPLLRAQLLRVEAEEHILLLTMHHIVSDAWSKWIFAQELAEFYEAHVLQRPSAWSEPALQYADYAQWQRNRLTDNFLEKHLRYWKQQLGDNLPVLDLPVDFPRPPVQTYRGQLKTFHIADSISKRLVELSQQQGVTLFMTLIAAYNVFLHRYARQEDILVGTPIANRNQLEVENLIGFFINTLVLRLSLKGDPSFHDLLSRVRDVSLEAYNHQDLPFEKLVEELRPDRDVSRSALFQAWFVFQNTPTARWDLPGLTASTTDIDWGITKFDLSLDMAETEQGLRGIFNYNVDLFRPQTIDSYCEQFITLLELVAEQPNLPLSQFVALMEQAERDQLMRRQQDLKQSVRSKFKKAKSDRNATDASGKGE